MPIIKFELEEEELKFIKESVSHQLDVVYYKSNEFLNDMAGFTGLIVDNPYEKYIDGLKHILERIEEKKYYLF